MPTHALLSPFLLPFTRLFSRTFNPLPSNAFTACKATEQEQMIQYRDYLKLEQTCRVGYSPFSPNICPPSFPSPFILFFSLSIYPFLLLSPSPALLPPLPKAYGKDDCVGCYIDLDRGSISFSKNGNFLGKAFDIPSHLIGSPFYPAVVLKVR